MADSSQGTRQLGAVQAPASSIPLFAFDGFDGFCCFGLSNEIFA
jgi:hypothetical protein